MKFLYILLLVLIFSSTRAQRVVNIDRRELKNYLCEDLAFFREYAALNIYNSKQDLFNIHILKIVRGKKIRYDQLI
jgi:hypothetical protein